MASTFLEACNVTNASKKRNQDLHCFQTFGTGDPLKPPFREAIPSFLQQFALLQNYQVSGSPLWSISFISHPAGIVFPLLIIEETAQLSPQPFCDHCKLSGWGHHFLSKRRYHLIIPAKGYWNKPLKSNFAKKSSTHFLHGLIHCNGYGHLVCINGSNLLTGNDLMDFWDHLCTLLNARKVSVRDVLKEGKMELRLLNGVAYGRCWFGKWGYRPAHGSYGVTVQEYEAAVQFLSSLGLDRVVNDLKNNQNGRKVQAIIDKYRDVSMKSLDTMSDLLKVMLDIKSSADGVKGIAATNYPKIIENNEKVLEESPSSLDSFLSRLVDNGSRWSAERLKNVLIIIVNLLKKNIANDGGRFGMSRYELREEARKCIGDTGLIDFVLKSIRCFVVGNSVVSRSNNPKTNLLEFTIHEADVEEIEGKPFNFKFSDGRWCQERLNYAAQLVLSILKQDSSYNIMSRQELHNKAKEFIDDSELIDCVLKSVEKFMIGNQVACRSNNPAAKRVRFEIQDSFDVSRVERFEILPDSSTVCEDLWFLYKNVLLGYPESEMVGYATRVVLDSKQFVKELSPEEQFKDQQLMSLTCQVLPSFDELETVLLRPLSPGELVIVPASYTIRQLKVVAQHALRDTYCVMQKFVVRQIGGLKAVEDDRVLSCTMEPGARMWIRGVGLDLNTKLRYEDGAHMGKVDCACGAKYDDGERLLVCDICHVCQHTKCSGIADGELVPSAFQCVSCSNKDQE